MLSGKYGTLSLFEFPDLSAERVSDSLGVPTYATAREGLFFDLPSQLPLAEGIESV